MIFDDFEVINVSPLTGDRLTDGEAFLMSLKKPSKPNEDIYRENCYICRDPDFAAMGMPLCRPCTFCQGHVPADDCVCTDCGKDQRP